MPIQRKTWGSFSLRNTINLQTPGLNVWIVFANTNICRSSRPLRRGIKGHDASCTRFTALVLRSLHGNSILIRWTILAFSVQGFFTLHFVCDGNNVTRRWCWHLQPSCPGCVFTFSMQIFVVNKICNTLHPTEGGVHSPCPLPLLRGQGFKGVSAFTSLCINITTGRKLVAAPMIRFIRRDGGWFKWVYIQRPFWNWRLHAYPDTGLHIYYQPLLQQPPTSYWARKR